MNIKEEIVKLVDLQKIDTQLYALKQQCHVDKPEQLEALETDFKIKRQTLTDAEESLKSAQLKKKDAEITMKTKEEGVAKSQGDLYKLKTNDEYKMKLREIEQIKADVSVAEEVVLRAMDDIEKATAAVNTAKAAFKAIEDSYTKDKNAIEAVIKQLQDQMKICDDKRIILKKQVNAQILSIYERIVEARRGLGIAPMVGGSCGGCYMSQPPDIPNKIRAYSEMVVCVNCGRLLYLKEDLELSCNK